MKRLLICALFLSCAWIAHQSSVSNIINQNYNKFFETKYGERSVDKRIPKVSHWMDSVEGGGHSHHCVHDKVADNFVRPKLETLQTTLMSNRLLHGKRSIEKRQTNSTNFAAMRFFVDGNLIDPNNNNDPRACYSENQQVPFYDDETRTDITHTCFLNETLSADLRTTINTLILPTLTTIFNSLLSVETTEGNFKLDSTYYNSAGSDNKQCYFDVPIPESYVTDGVANADYIIFVTARPADISTVAYALGCNFQIINNGQDVGRPLAGIINFNPAYFVNFTGGQFSEFDFRAAVKVAVHELTHALGFSSSLYQFYRDMDTGELYDPEIDSTTTVRGTSPSGDLFSQDIAKIAAPRALGFAQNHFGCSSLDGVELEDIGGAGTAGSHWEKRVCGDELMTGFINKAMPISGLTLSLLEDMGWYRANYSQAEYWGWGKEQGCPFVQERCENSWPSSAKGYWCNNSTVISSCTADRRAKGTCSTFQYDFTIKAYYQHFVDPSQGGLDAAADVCPYTIAAIYCADESLNSQTNSGGISEFYGENSGCFDTIGGDNSMNAACLVYVCSNNGTTLQVNISGQLLDCPSNGGYIDASSISAGLQINCPTTALLCGITEPMKADRNAIPSNTANTFTSDVTADTADTNIDTSEFDTNFDTNFDSSGFFESFLSSFFGAETTPTIAEESSDAVSSFVGIFTISISLALACFL